MRSRPEMTAKAGQQDDCLSVERIIIESVGRTVLASRNQEEAAASLKTSLNSLEQVLNRNDAQVVRIDQSSTFIFHVHVTAALNKGLLVMSKNSRVVIIA